MKLPVVVLQKSQLVRDCPDMMINFVRAKGRVSLKNNIGGGDELKRDQTKTAIGIGSGLSAQTK